MARTRDLESKVHRNGWYIMIELLRCGWLCLLDIIWACTGRPNSSCYSLHGIKDMLLFVD